MHIFRDKNIILIQSLKIIKKNPYIVLDRNIFNNYENYFNNILVGRMKLKT